MTDQLPKFQIQKPVVTKGKIQFDGFEKIKASAELLADHIQNVEVTENNVKESKKLLAAVNSEVKKLDSQRIQIKNEMLVPYQSFETQVKEIVKIVKDADESVRMQVRELEEAERDKKKEAIKRLFNKRIQMYEFKNLFTFDDFLEPKYLNKTMSMNKVETSMINWLTKIDDDLVAIEKMDYNDEILAEYQCCQSLAISVKRVQDRHEQVEKNKKVTYNEQAKKVSKSSFVFTLKNEKDAKLVEMFMETNNIKFEKVEK